MARDHRPAARPALSATVALAAAALAPTEPPPPPEEMERVEGGATTPDEWLSKVAELNTANEALTARVAELEAALDEQRESFNRAWREREEQIPAPLPDPPAIPARPKTRIAAASIACRSVSGAAMEIKPGAPIPDDADLAGVPAWAIEEV